MKNLFLCIFLLAGTFVVAQSSQSDLQKELGITEVQAKQVAEIQTKYCNHLTGCTLPEGKAKADLTPKEYKAEMAKAQEAYYAALVRVIPEAKAEILLEKCKKECNKAMAQLHSKKGKKRCCPGHKKSCHEKKSDKK